MRSLRCFLPPGGLRNEFSVKLGRGVEKFESELSQMASGSQRCALTAFANAALLHTH